MLNHINIFAPILMLILTGWCIRRFFITDLTFWDSLNRFIYYFALPVLLVTALWQMDINLVKWRELVFSAVSITLLISLLLFTIKKYLSVDNKTFSSIFQGGIRYNTYILVGLLTATMGTAGIVFFGILSISMITVTNILSISVLSMYSGSGSSIYFVFKKTITCPLIVAALLGFLLNASGLKLPNFLATYFDYISSSVIALSMLAVGSGLKLHKSIHNVRHIILSCSIKLVLMPVLMMLCITILLSC